MKGDLFTLINFLGFINGFMFTIIVLINKKKNSTVSFTFAFLLFVLSVLGAGSFCSYAGLFSIFPAIQKLFSPFFFLLGPSLLFYYRSLLFKNFKVKLIFAAHFIPFFINIMYNIPFYMKPNSEKIALLSLGITFSVKIIRLIAITHFVAYSIFIVKSIKNYRVIAKRQFSSLSNLRIKWMYFVQAIVFTVLIINLAPEISIPVFSDLIKIWESLLILFIIYKGLTQPEIFFNTESPTIKANLKPDELENILKKITNFMDHERPYLDPDITLSSFAEKINIPVRQCSFVLNNEYNQNFFNFINKYRVDHFKKRYTKSKNKQKILKTAFESGFNSKSTFNSAFKKFEGITPSQYLKTMK